MATYFVNKLSQNLSTEHCEFNHVVQSSIAHILPLCQNPRLCWQIYNISCLKHKSALLVETSIVSVIQWSTQLGNHIHSVKVHIVYACCWTQAELAMFGHTNDASMMIKH